ncbi:unnamed protein product [Gongylonema pulchrum]|uniref:DOCK7 n=1 Tax=Gongylonema pulchrum TaxID=637853 RepID=A0A183EA91_9BILA|nr:unnamed protein product [Gongylonema pulchrum]
MSSRKQSVSSSEKQEHSEVHQRDAKNLIRYTREELFGMKDLPASRVRPECLSADFDKYHFIILKNISRPGVPFLPSELSGNIFLKFRLSSFPGL